MSAPAHAISIEHEVPFHDTDALAIVWHGNYYKYFGMASTELFRSRGLLPTDLEALGVVLVVAESRCRHSFPLRYTDRFRVRAWFEDVDLAAPDAEILEKIWGNLKGSFVLKKP